MITHVIVELKQPVKEEFFHMDTVLPSEYYGYGTPLIRCKDCKYYRWEIDMCDEPYSTAHNVVHEDDYCSRAERKEE